MIPHVRRIAVAALWLVPVPFAMAQVPAAGCISPEALEAPTGKIGFTQTRTLKGVPRPIVSRGEATIDGDIILWRVTQPIEIVTRIAPEGVTQSVDNGPFEPLSQTAGGDFTAETGLAAVLKADMSALETRYSITSRQREGEAGWHLELLPRSEALQTYISKLDVEGCTSFQRIVVTQTDGDTIRVDLSDHHE